MEIFCVIIHETSTASLLGLHGAQLSAVGNPAVSAALKRDAKS